MFPTVTEKQGTFGGGKHPLVDVRVKFVNFLIPEGHDVINGQLYRMIYDWESLQAITYPDGSHPDHVCDGSSGLAYDRR